MKLLLYFFLTDKLKRKPIYCNTPRAVNLHSNLNRIKAYVGPVLQLPFGHQGCQIFPLQHTKTGKNLQNDHKYSKWPHNIPTSSVSRPSKIYPNWDFGLKIYVPSGNPGGHLCILPNIVHYSQLVPSCRPKSVAKKQKKSNKISRKGSETNIPLNKNIDSITRTRFFPDGSQSCRNLNILLTLDQVCQIFLNTRYQKGEK
jgi:hypothetical protein